MRIIFVEVCSAAKEPEYYCLFKLIDKINETMFELIAPVFTKHIDIVFPNRNICATTDRWTYSNSLAEG